MRENGTLVKHPPRSSFYCCIKATERLHRDACSIAYIGRSWRGLQRPWLQDPNAIQDTSAGELHSPLPRPLASSSAIAAPFSAIMMVGLLVLLEAMVGITEASMTRGFSRPRMRSRSFTTAPGSAPMRPAAVTGPAGGRSMAGDRGAGSMA